MSQVSLGQISVAKSGRVLGLSARQARRVWKRYQREGDAGLVHRLRGRASNASDADFRKRVLARYRQRYLEFGPAHAAEHLEREGLVVPRQTLWYWLDQENLIVCRRRGSPHRMRRERRPSLGELIQMDGSTHDWLSGRGPACVLFVMVDDATGRVFCRFYASEDTASAFDLFGRYVKKHGLPQALYVDKDSIYRVNDPKAREAGEWSGRLPQTQFGRAMKQLAVAVICADSPQAKGRVERMNGTLQDRLVKELTLVKARTIEQANAFLDKTFLRQFNQRFTKAPGDGVNLHRRVPAEVNLAQILCVIEERCVGRDWCVSHHGRVLQIDKKHEGLSLAGRRVQLLIGKDGKLRMRYQGAKLRWCEVSTRPVHKPLRQLPTAGKLSWRPGADHPWNREARQARSATETLAALASPPLRRLDERGGGQFYLDRNP
jgi:transposase-like protein